MARSYLPSGFRFHPTDEELTLHYLKKKVAGKTVQEGVIGEVDIYKFEPCELPGLAISCSRDSQWFFFTPQDNKARTNRTTRGGYWKATCKDRKIQDGTSTIGWKKTLVYHLGRAPSGECTDWIMHEYRLHEEYEKRMNCARSFVLCRVRRKGGPGPSPRNGDQYGAPVLEPSDGVEAALSPNSSLKFIGADMPSEGGEIVDQTMGPNVPLGRNERDAKMGDLDSILFSRMVAEQQEQPLTQEDLCSVDDVLDLLVNHEEVADMGPTQMASFNDMDLSSLDPLHDLLHPVMSEADILEELLQQVETSGDLGASHSPNRARFSINDVQSGGFLELADLEEPLDGHPPDKHLDELIKELDYGLEDWKSNKSEQNERSSLPNSHSIGHGLVDVRSTQPYKSLSMEQSSQVPAIIISNELGRVGITHSSLLLASDDGSGLSDDLPSGSLLSSDQEGPSFSTVPADMAPASVCEVSGGISVSRKDNPDLQSEGPPTSEKATNEEKFLGERTMLPTPPSPSSLVARVLSVFLGKVNVLPASAAELPMKHETHRNLPKGGLNSYEAKIKLIQADMGSLRSRKFCPASFSVFIPEMEQVPRRTYGKGFANGLSMFLFGIATSALILFCFFRECCKSTRIAFGLVL